MDGFINLTENPLPFWNILPDDWRQEIEPVWQDYGSTASVYGLITDNELCAGLICFTTVSPDTGAYAALAQSWFDRGYYYLGFLYVPDDRRNRGYGSTLMRELFKHTPQKDYWLSIEEYSLRRYYEKLSFKYKGEIHGESGPEWIMSRIHR